MKSKKSGKEEFYTLNKKFVGYCLIAIIIIAIFVGLYYSGVIDLPALKSSEKAEQKTEKKVLDNFTISVGAPEVELLVIENKACKECINVSEVIEIIKGAPTLKVKSDKIVAHDSAEGREIISEYSLKRLPAFVLKILSSEKIESLPPFESRKGALVYDATPPPYFDVTDETVKGVVRMQKIIAEDCSECFNLDVLVKNLKMFGIVLGEEKSFAYDSEEGKKIVEKYGIKSVPTLIFSGDALEYEQIAEVWDTIGTVEDDGMMVLRTVNPPYWDIDSDRVKGIVEIIYLVDETCTQCYDPVMLKQMFESQLAMKFSLEKKVDISTAEGKSLVQDFGIKLVPTIIMSEDAGEYPGISSVWDQIGIVKDSTYVLTKIDLIPNAVYKDIEKDELIGLEEDQPEEPEAEAAAD